VQLPQVRDMFGGCLLYCISLHLFVWSVCATADTTRTSQYTITCQQTQDAFRKFWPCPMDFSRL